MAWNWAGLLIMRYDWPLIVRAAPAPDRPTEPPSPV